MPVDHTPVKPSTSKEDSGPSQKEEWTEEKPEQQQQQAERLRVPASTARYPQIGKFWLKRPKLWFVQLEAEFHACNITRDSTKYTALIRHLDEQSMDQSQMSLRSHPWRISMSILKQP
ncbi:hypothetical protein KPH14_012764 [Odynerus spinipes]|uniref:DUF7041 domain-containing protein n=1 Tax=Odynerus spinipes TaxID=1348599 RepID=A0AAD9R8T6_9HYME|nr:hypothetical protein KPH14_012764 [Odynerus spinipes]